MKSKVSLLILTAVLLGLSLNFLSLRHPATVAAVVSRQAQGAREIEERIRRVENGLLPLVAIKGRPAEMKLGDRMKFYRVPGVSVAVINNGRIEWARGLGVIEAGLDKPITTDTLFQAGSISKPVAAMAALRLAEQGKLNLDEDVNLKLKSWEVPGNEFTKEKKVTLRGILTHSAGLTVHGFPGYKADAEVPSLVQVLNGEKPANTGAIRVDTTPGTRWRYSGGGYTIMQQLLIDVTGKAFPELARDLVLAPAGMKRSTYEQPLPKQLDPAAATAHMNGKPIKGRYHTYPEMAAAGLWTTPTDLALLAIEIQQEIAGKSNKVLSSQMARQMVSKQFDDYGLGPVFAGSGRSERFSHGGVDEGFEAYWIAYSHTGQGAVVMTNGNRGSALAQEVIRGIAKEYGWPDPPAPREKTLAKLDPKVYEAYAGEYQVAARWVVSVEDGRLYLLAPLLGPDKIELFPESEVRFFMLSNNIVINFDRDEQGQVKKMQIYFGGGTTREANKVK
jgi:CubicO group peptidase (beta-lactamase class C family)